MAERDRCGAIDVGWTAPAHSGCLASKQDGHGVLSHITLFWIPVPGECGHYRMILATGLMLTLSITKGSQEQQGETVAWAARGLLRGGAGAGRDRRAGDDDDGDPRHGCGSRQCQAEHDAAGRGAGGAAVITSVRYQVQVWRLPFADALPERMRDTRPCTRSAGLFPLACAIGAETADSGSSAVGADADAAP